MSTTFTDRSTPFLYKKVKFTRRIGLKCPKSYKITKKVVTLTHHTFIKMEEVICRINPANSNLFAGLIRQIVAYLPD